MEWRSKLYVDLALPIGLHSAPYIFNSVADLVEWTPVHNYKIPDFLHYLDDLITVGPPDSPLCVQYLQTAFNVCEQLGLPIHPAKSAGPSPMLTVWGTELDSLAQVARVPVDKFLELKSLVLSWMLR